MSKDKHNDQRPPADEKSGKRAADVPPKTQVQELLRNEENAYRAAKERLDIVLDHARKDRGWRVSSS